jgi:hypothetical protein
VYLLSAAFAGYYWTGITYPNPGTPITWGVADEAEGRRQKAEGRRQSVSFVLASKISIVPKGLTFKR